MNPQNTLVKICALVALPIMMLSGCATDLNSSSYVSSSTVGKVLEGTVVSARQVTVKENNSLQGNTAGLLAGGVLGGLGGSAIGKGKGNTAAIAGAALAGAALGTVVQDRLGKSQGMEYVVRLDPKYAKPAPQHVSSTVTTFSGGKGSVQDQLNQSIDMTDTRSDLISVVQGMDVVFQPGQHVLIIYSDDRPRLAPLNY